MQPRGAAGPEPDGDSRRSRGAWGALRTPAVVAASYLGAGLAAALDAPAVVRGPLVAWAVLGASALPLAELVGARGRLERAVLGVAGAAAVVMVVAQLVLYAGAWSPVAVLALTGAAALALATGQALAPPSPSSAPAPADRVAR